VSAWFHHRFKKNELVAAHIGIAFSLVALAIMMHAEKLSVGFFWLVEMAVIFALGVYYREYVYRILASVLGGAIIVRFFFVDLWRKMWLTLFRGSDNMRTNNIIRYLIIILSIATLHACSFQQAGKISLVDAKIASGIDERLMPVGASDIFPEGTSKVSCWIRWKDALLNTQLVIKWHYVTDDVHISDYSLTIPKKEGSGSIDFRMSTEKGLPAGLYRVDICLGKRVLRSLTFTIQ